MSNEAIRAKAKKMRIRLTRNGPGGKRVNKNINNLIAEIENKKEQKKRTILKSKKSENRLQKLFRKLEKQRLLNVNSEEVEGEEEMWLELYKVRNSNSVLYDKYFNALKNLNQKINAVAAGNTRIVNIMNARLSKKLGNKLGTSENQKVARIIKSIKSLSNQGRTKVRSFIEENL